MANDNYYSDREFGQRQRVEEEVSDTAWGGIAALVIKRIKSGWFGSEYPEECPDGSDVIGTNETMMSLAINGDIPDLVWPYKNNETPSDAAIFDFIEFCYDKIGVPIMGGLHRFYGHYHYDGFDYDNGQASFLTDINRILTRNGPAYKLNQKGHIIRIGAPILREPLSDAIFATGDDILDSMLEMARAKFSDPDQEVNREALEKLWDAWERLKTIEPGIDKRASVTTLLDNATSAPKFRMLLEKEAFELTRIGNDHLIRHSETSKEMVATSIQVNYLFYRLFALIYLLLQSRETLPI